MYLVDTNVWLELLLDQEKAEQVRAFNEKFEATLLAITEFSLYSIGVILSRLNKDDVFADFLSDSIEDSGVAIVRLTTKDLSKLVASRQELGLDFDDAYQYAAAKKHRLTLISFDSDFDKTVRGRKTPMQVLQE